MFESKIIRQNNDPMPTLYSFKDYPINIISTPGQQINKVIQLGIF